MRPFPWSSLDSITRAEVLALQSAGRWVAQYVDIEGAEDALGRLVGTKVAVLARRVRPLSHALEFGAGLGVLLSNPAEPPEVSLVLVQVERALAAELVARAVRRPPPALVDPEARSAAVAGAFAAILLATASRSHAAVRLRVVSAGEAAAAQADFVRPESEPIAVAITFTVLVADQAYAARVAIRAPAALSAPPAWTHQELARLGSMPLSMPVVACAARTTVADVASLQRGDVFVPGGLPIARLVGGDWHGPVFLSAPGATTALRADLGENGRLVLRGGAVPLDAAEAAMEEWDARPEIVDAVGEIPVVVRVEIGQAHMLAREWAALRHGDVVTLGTRIGERVLLRVGGVVVARGELVEIEGEVGVRVVERLSEDSTDA